MLNYSWIVLHTKPNQERLAIENITRQGFEVYCPMVAMTRRHARRVETVMRPLFPGYVFVKILVDHQQWRPLLSTRGVLSVVRFGTKPGVLPSGFVQELVASENCGELEELVKPRFCPGENVIVREGPFREIIGRVMSTSENDRVWLLMDMMGREVRISQSCDVLDRLSA